MKPTRTLADAQNQLLASIRSLAELTVYHVYPSSYDSDKNAFAKAHQNFLNAVRCYAEALVCDAYSRYDPYDGGEFLTREAYEEVLKSLKDDEVIPMEEITKELGIK